MTDDLPWREVTTDDYHPRVYHDLTDEAAWIASTERVRHLIRDQDASLYRTRPVLREAVDFAPRVGREPDWFWDYAMGPTLVLRFAEIVIEGKNGQRVCVEL